MSTLSKKHFDMHPIWSEYYDYDERDEIVDWGVDPQWLVAELERVHDCSDHCAYPILRPYPLPDRMRLFIRARIKTADGNSLDGYVLNDDAYVLCIFTPDCEFGFSRHSALGDLDRKNLEGLAEALGRQTDGIFPLAYETEFLDSHDNRIRGIFPFSDGSS